MFRYPDLALPTLLAFAYTLSAYILGFLLLAAPALWPVLGVLLLAHSMVIAAFLLHECVHASLFARQSLVGVEPHEGVAALLTWITGSCYSDFAAIRSKHLRHHFERADIVAIDYRSLLARSAALRKLVECGQWLGLPAIELLFHVLSIYAPIRQGDSRARRRVLVVFMCRMIALGVLVFLFGWQMLLGYAVAYCLFLTVMGFMDAYQHQYLLLTGLDRPRAESPTQDRSRFGSDYFSREYEQRRTFTNVISRRWPLLNLLVLNFCYHNAHHHRPSEPWLRLPELHRELKAQMPAPVEIAFKHQLYDFFRYRVERVMTPASDSLHDSRAVGAAGVSFLTPL